jgi:uncharacterized protein (TIGR04255 family)
MTDSEPLRTVFKNVPITEALVDIRVKLPPQSTLERLITVYDVVKEAYPNKRERLAWQGGLQLRPNLPPELQDVRSGPDGYLFSSADGTQLMQARLDGFTFNRLRPYDRWETFIAEARKLWEIYSTVGHPSDITRLAIRYLNRIEIPLPLRDFKDYILTVPEIAPGIPQALANFLMRLVIPIPESSAMAIVSVAMDPGTTEDKLPIIFDIDVFRQGSFGVDGANIWEIFESLHQLKNQIFFKSITEKAKELFA